MNVKLFAGVDRAVFAVSFGERLRGAGVDVSLTAVERCAAALDVVPAPSLRDLYWLCRVSFVDRQPQLQLFDAVFAAVFDLEAGRLPNERRGQQQQSAMTGDDVAMAPVRTTNDAVAATTVLPWATLPSFGAGDDSFDGDDGDELAVPELAPSLVSVDADRPFDLLDDAELVRVGRLLESAVLRWPQRRSRRTRRAATGRVDVRRSLQRARQSGGDVVQLLHSRTRRVPRRVVVILDVSGSMENYARAYLHLTRPLAMQHRAEVFAFSTELTRITPSVRLRSPADAVDHISDAVGDRFSGTRLASSLDGLLKHRTWSTSLRGSVVLICSDGWDSDEPARLDRVMQRLSRMAHRVVWVNPRAAAAGFEPVTGGMSAALPHCDTFLAGNTARSMRDVVDALTAA